MLERRLSSIRRAASRHGLRRDNRIRRPRTPQTQAQRIGRDGTRALGPCYFDFPTSSSAIRTAFVAERRKLSAAPQSHTPLWTFGSNSIGARWISLSPATLTFVVGGSSGASIFTPRFANAA